MTCNCISAWVVFLTMFTTLVPCGVGEATREVGAAVSSSTTVSMQKRWLFIWRDMKDAKEVDRMIERFPRAKAAGYNGVAFACDLVESKAAALRQAAQRNGLDLIAIVMGGSVIQQHGQHHRQPLSGIVEWQERENVVG